jgi:hypothetical protein
LPFFRGFGLVWPIAPITLLIVRRWHCSLVLVPGLAPPLPAPVLLLPLFLLLAMSISSKVEFV